MGTVILSPHPLRGEGVVPNPAGVVAQHQPIAVAELPNMGSVRVAAVHPMPPTVAAKDWSAMLGQIGEWQRGADDLPLVVAGDFNASTAHPQLRSLAEGMQSASPRWWMVPQPSWPVDSPVPAFTGIDHVFVRWLRVLDAERITVDGTDHAGVLARLGGTGPQK